MKNDSETLYEKYNVNTYIEVVKEALGNASNLEKAYKDSIFGGDYKDIPLELNISHNYPISHDLICIDETENDDNNNKTVSRTYTKLEDELSGKTKESITLDDQGNLVKYSCYSMYNVSTTVNVEQDMVGIKIKNDSSYTDYDFEPVRYYDDTKQLDAIISLNDQGSLDVDLKYNIFKDMNDEYGGSKGDGFSFDSTDKIIVEKTSDFKFCSSEEKNVTPNIR